MSNTPKKEILSVSDALILWKLHERLESIQRDIDYYEKTAFKSAVERYFDSPSDEDDKYAHRYAKQEVLGIKISTALSKILMDYLATISAADLRAKVVGKGNNPWLCEIQQTPEEPLD
jgi:hypothetical protein